MCLDVLWDFLYTQTCIYISKIAALQEFTWTAKEVELVLEAVKSYMAKKENDRNWLRTIEKYIWGLITPTLLENYPRRLLADVHSEKFLKSENKFEELNRVQVANKVKIIRHKSIETFASTTFTLLKKVNSTGCRLYQYFSTFSLMCGCYFSLAAVTYSLWNNIAGTCWYK